MKKTLFDVGILIDTIQKNVGKENVPAELKKLKRFYKQYASIDELESNNNSKPEDFLNAKEVGNLLKISSTTLWRYVVEGMPVIKGKKKRLFVKSQIIKWYDINIL